MSSGPLGVRHDSLSPFSPPPFPGQPMTFPPEALWVTVGLSICLVALLVALAFVCWRKIKQSCEEEDAGKRERLCACVSGYVGVSMTSTGVSLSSDRMNVCANAATLCVYMCDLEAEQIPCV